MNILEALKAQTDPGGETYVELNADGPTVIPGGDDLLLAEFTRLGPDLQITMPDGESVVVVDYFNAESGAQELATESGAVVNGDLVSQLAGPMVPDSQVAQTGTSDALGEPAGAVDSMKGVVVAMRGGVEVELNAGDSIYEGDVIVTAADSAVGIIFADDSTMSMGGDARIAIDEMVYDPSTGDGNQLFDIVQGAFVFASGQIGKVDPENVQVRTPVATIGIRGTKYAVNVDQELGDATITLFEGAVVVENAGGQVLLNSIGQTTQITSSFSSPGDVFIMDTDTQTNTYGDAIDYHPNEAGKRNDRDDDGGGGDDGGDLSAEELEKLAEELDDLDTAAGPSGVIAGFTQSALFLRLFNTVLEGGEFTSGTLLGSFDGEITPLDFERPVQGPGLEPTPITGPIDSITNILFGDGGGSVTYTYGNTTNLAVQGGSGFDLFTIDSSGTTTGTGWEVTNSNGNVIITETGGAGTQINMSGVEELGFDLGGSGDNVTIGDLNGTDIADDTVIINAGAGDDVIEASEAGKRLVVDGGDGDDTITGSTSNDDLAGGAGDDTLDGGTGNDFLDGGIGDDTLIVTLAGGSVQEQVTSQGEDFEFDFGNSEIAAAREYDIVIGGAGDDTVVLNIPANLAADPDFANDLIALKNDIESGETQGLVTYETLGLQISGVENIEFGGALPNTVITPVLTTGDAVEDGDALVSLSLDGDYDSPLLSVSVTVSGVPEGAVLVASDGTRFEGGDDINLTAAQTGDMTIELAEDSDADLALSVSVSAESLLTDDSSTQTAEGDIAVAGVADDPIVDVSDATGLEDGAPIALSIDVSSGDADGSETLSVAIDGLPEGAVLKDVNGTEVDPANVSVDALDGLTVTPPADFSGEMSLTVVTTSSEGETTATDTQTLTVTVSATADAPTVAVSDVVGQEDGSIALSISVTASGDDDTEGLSIAVSGLPQGAVLQDAEGAEVDATNIPLDALDGLTVVPPSDFSGTLSLSVAATSSVNGTTATETQSFTVDVTAVADTPVVEVTDVIGQEDGTVGLSISVSSGDADGSETLSLSIEGLPEGAALLDAEGAAIDPSNVPVEALSGLSISLPEDFSGDIPLTVVATSSEGETSAVESKTFTVDVTGVADAPVVTVADARGDEGFSLPLSLSAELTDTDGSETLSVEISGLPQGVTLSDGENTYSGSPVSVPQSALGSLSAVPAAGFVGTVVLSVVATASEADGDTAQTTQTLNVTFDDISVPPVLSVLNASGAEDGAIALTVDASDQNGDAVTITITGLPEGASLTNGLEQSFSGDEITLTEEQLAGLTVHPADDSDADFTLTVTASSGEGDDFETVSSDLSVTVSGVADTPSLTVAAAEGIEDVPVELDIAAALGDLDGSENLSVEIDGLQEGFSLVDGEGTPYTGSPVSVPAEMLDGLTLTTPEHFAGEVSLTVRAIATEADGGDTALIEKNLTVTIDPDLDIPTVTVEAVSGAEDTSIPLEISLGNLDPNQALTISLEDLPEGAVLTNTAGDSFTGSPVSLTADQLDGLAVTPPQDSAVDFDLKVTVTTSQGEETAQVSETFSVAVAAKADAPDVTIGDTEVILGRADATTEIGTSGADTIIGGAGGDSLLGGGGDDHLIGDGENLGATVALDIQALTTDTDGSELLTVTISDLPDGVQLLQGGDVLVTGGSVTLSADMLDDVSLIVPPATSDFDLQVTTRVVDIDPDGGGDSSTQTAVISVSVDDGSGLDSNDYLDGGAGNDVLDGGVGADTLLGGEGNDTLHLGQGEDLDVADGGAGTDTLILTVNDQDLQSVEIVTDLQELYAFVTSGAAAEDSMHFEALNLDVSGVEEIQFVDPDGESVDVFDIVFPDPGAGITYSGDNDDNVATGTDLNDVMSGGAGDDTLSGGAGNDTLSGDEGDDLLLGGADADVLDGGAGNDEIQTEGGSGTVTGGTGDDLAVVTIDPDVNDRDLALDGGADNDVLRIELSNDQPDLEGVIAEIAEAGVAAHQDPDGTHSLESLGITFTNFEDVEIYVDGEQVDFDPEVSAGASQDVATDDLGEGVAVLNGIEISDVDGNLLTQATVEISGGFTDGDSLTISQDLLDQHGLTLDSAEVSEGGYTLTLSGEGSLAAYQEALAGVCLCSDASVPDPGARTVSVTVTDDDGNASELASVSVNVSAPAAPELTDSGEEARDSVAYVSDAGDSGATVTEVTGPSSSVTQSLTLEVGKLGNGGTGQFEVIVGGTSLGIFAASNKVENDGTGWEEIEIENVTLPIGEDAQIEVKAVSENSNVLLKSISFGDTVLNAADDASSDVGDLIRSVGDNMANGQGFFQALSNSIDEFVNAFSDNYIMLDPQGEAASYAIDADGAANTLDDWHITEDGLSRAVQDEDLGQRFDEIDMGEGTDWAVAAAGTDGNLDVDLDGPLWSGTENALGGSGDDVLSGNDSANLLAGGGGDDVLIAQGNDDLLIGGAGSDEMRYDIEELAAAGTSESESGFGTVDQAIADAYAANDIDGAEALENLRAGVDGGSGSDTLKLSGGNGEANSLSGDVLAGAVNNIEILDVTGVDGPVDMALSVDDLIEMTDERDELKILKDGEDTVEVDGQQLSAGEHTVSVDGVDFKLVIEDQDPNAGV